MAVRKYIQPYQRILPSKARVVGTIDVLRNYHCHYTRPHYITTTLTGPTIETIEPNQELTRENRERTFQVEFKPKPVKNFGILTLFKIIQWQDRNREGNFGSEDTKLQRDLSSLASSFVMLSLSPPNMVCTMYSILIYLHQNMFGLERK